MYTLFRNSPLVLAVAGTTVSLLPAHAADTELPPVVVVAARSAQELAQRTQDVTVIPAEAIAAAGHSSLGELLARQHGLELTSSGGPQGTTGLFIRGSNPGHTLILIDGQRVGSSTAGGASLNAIPLHQVERIEILRGPSSSLYGANAIGGVINIITRQGQGPLRFNAELGAGSHGRQLASVGAGGQHGQLDFSAQLLHERSDGFSSLARPDPGNPYDSYNADDDGFERESFSGRAGWQWAEGQRLMAQLLYSEQDGQFDGVPGYDDREQVRVASWSVSSDNRLSASWRSLLRLGQTLDDSTTDYGGFSYRYRTRQVQGSWQNELQLSTATRLTLGLDRLQEEISAAYIAGPIPDSRSTTSAIAVYHWQAGPQRLQLNLRHDHSSQYGDEPSGAASWGYQLLPALRLAASLGSAFQAPTFNDLYYPGYGQTTIQPERSFNRELGLYVQGQGFDGSLVAYYNRVRDLIAYQYPCTTPGYDFGCAANVRNARLRGLSLGWQQQLGATRLDGHADWQSAEDADAGTWLPRRARVHGTLGLSHQLQDWTFGAELQGSGERYDDTANSQRLGGYGLVNAFVSWQLLADWSLHLRVNNVADRDYELAQRYATGGRTAMLSLRWQP